MKPLIILLLLTGCASVNYKSVDKDGRSEELRIFSIFRSLEGLEAERNKFKLKINKAKGEVTPEELADALLRIRPF